MATACGTGSGARDKSPSIGVRKDPAVQRCDGYAVPGEMTPGCHLPARDETGGRNHGSLGQKSAVRHPPPCISSVKSRIIQRFSSLPGQKEIYAVSVGTAKPPSQFSSTKKQKSAQRP
ncbi:predicted protein [Coccidioides posadasii str. Silveira]|uniref:Predicted protein n=1 Tax=Coccidioides posadasii (strain RMSCC 757 / Silveira) TaxID=443226 RepID=E9D657_COCPS|nr:predicted protein [Coccidioides posadasii str. Silveira]